MLIDYLDKFSGTLLGVAIGDTLGHPFEGVLREAIHSYFTDLKNLYKATKDCSIHTQMILN